MERQPQIVTRAEWSSDPDLWRGRVEGVDIDAKATVLFFATKDVGAGPRLHVHDYDEMFVVRTGRALFTVGDRKIEAAEGAVLMAPANVPHKFENLGPGLLETIDIHLNDRFVQTDLEDPETSVG